LGLQRRATISGRGIESLKAMPRACRRDIWLLDREVGGLQLLRLMWMVHKWMKKWTLEENSVGLNKTKMMFICDFLFPMQNAIFFNVEFYVRNRKLLKNIILVLLRPTQFSSHLDERNR